MAKLWVVIKREYLERVRSKWFIISTIFGPVFFMAITILPGYMTMRGMKEMQVSSIHILDATGTGLGQRVADRLQSQQRENQRVTVPGGSVPPAMPSVVEDLAPAALAPAESVATKLVMEKQTQGYLVLDSLTIVAQKARYAGRNASSLPQMDMIEAAVRQSLMASRMQDAGIAPSRIDSLTRVKVDVARERLDEKGRGGSGIVGAIFGFVIALLCA